MENFVEFASDDFGKKLKQLRCRKGMTQQELSEILNLSPQHLSKLERGSKNPTLQLIVFLSQYFRVSSEYLLGIPTYESEEKIKQIDAIIAACVDLRTKL